MNQTPEALCTSPNLTPESPNSAPGWQKCLDCPDLGTACNGPSLRTLGDIASARAYHKALRKQRKIQLKRIAEAAHNISEATVNEYFSNVEKDYKSTTVFEICDALVAICGNRVGMPPLTNPCPSSSSEVRAQLAAAELKVAAADLKVLQAEKTVTDLQREIIEVKSRGAERVDNIQSNMKWLQKQVFMWQCLCFAMVAVLIFILLLHSH